MSFKFNYFEVEQVITLHNNIISISSGLLGVLDHGRLESVLMHIQNDSYYPNLLDKITHLVYSIIQNHAFVDGNKRTALACGAYFLGLNGHDKKIDRYLDIMEDVVVNVASNQTNKDELKIILENIISNKLVKKLEHKY
jgi:death on curing protein